MYFKPIKRKKKNKGKNISSDRIGSASKMNKKVIYFFSTE